MHNKDLECWPQNERKRCSINAAQNKQRMYITKSSQKSILLMGVKLDHFRDFYLASLRQSTLQHDSSKEISPNGVKREITSAKCDTKENGTVKKVIKHKPNLTLDEIKSRFKIVRIEDLKSAQILYRKSSRLSIPYEHCCGINKPAIF